MSIITLVRNTNDLLKFSVNSLISQSNPNWENIIINDGSKKKILIEICFILLKTYDDSWIVKDLKQVQG